MFKWSRDHTDQKWSKCQIFKRCAIFDELQHYSKGNVYLRYLHKIMSNAFKVLIKHANIYFKMYL